VHQYALAFGEGLKTGTSVYWNCTKKFLCKTFKILLIITLIYAVIMILMMMRAAASSSSNKDQGLL